jgi:hypothetical protein
MPYYINRTDGTSLVTVQDGSVDNTTTSLSLVGKNYPTYGQILNQNLVSLIENFAASSAPEYSLTGQVWYDNANKSLNFYRDGSVDNYWQKLAVTSEGDTAPSNPRLGDLWWDSSNSQLKLYDTITLSWKVIGPQTTNDGSLRVLGNNSFVLQVGGNNALTVDTYGALTLTYNPCFYGYNHVDGENLTTSGIESYNTWKPIYQVDRGTNFNSTFGQFTVRTPGMYKVYAQVTTLGGPNLDLENEIRLRWCIDEDTAGSTITSSNNHSDTMTSQLICSGILDCISGKKISLAYSTSTDCQISYTDSTYSIQLVG